MKKILFAASEAVPFIKTGGLADVAGALAVHLPELGYDTRVILPCHRIIKSDGKLGGYAGDEDLKLALLELEQQYK